MTELTQTPAPASARAEKLRAIAAVFGDAMAARIGAGTLPGGPVADDPDRLAWQTNRLIRHLRDRVETGAPLTPPDRAAPAAPAATRPDRQGTAPRDAIPPRPTRLPVLVDGEDLAAEHPAVIAHILRAEPQHIRVSVLRALPGTVARAVMQRLRTA